MKNACHLYYYLLVNQSEIANMANGGAQANLSKTIIEELKLIVPLKETLSELNLSIFIDKREKLTRENKILKQLKDLLLVKMTRVGVEEEINIHN